MPAAMEVILLERVGSLGNLGDRVKVKPGYARNYLLPQNKALRATPANVSYFESQKKEIEKQNDANKKEAEKRAKTMEGTTVVLIRHAAEGGQLYGSVSARDIADAVSAQGKESIGRGMVDLNQSVKTIGLFDVPVALHPEVTVTIKVNVARSEDEAKIQAKTGKAMVAEEEDSAATIRAKAEQELEEASGKSKQELMEDEALEIEKEKAEAKAKKAEEEEAKRQAKAEKEAAKVKAEAEEAEESGEDGEAAAEAEAPAEDNADSEEKA